MKSLLIIFLWMVFSLPAVSQDSLSLSNLTDGIGSFITSRPPGSAEPAKRKWIVGAGSVALYGGSLLLLEKTWYDQYPRTSFHTFNDSREWMQVDKVGHAWSVYNASRATTAAWLWAGMKPDKAVLLGSLSGFTYLTVIEWLDAHSDRWGWSWADMGANLGGAVLFAGQEWLWNQQRIQFKYSAHRKKYEASLEQRADELYGSSLQERLLKDYNNQTYWLSFNLKSFFPSSSLPPWLNFSLGYGADGMFGGFENLARDKDGNIIFDRRDIARLRQWYLAPDIDLTRIKTGSRFLKTAFSVLNSVKFPLPALEYSGNRIRGRWVGF